MGLHFHFEDVNPININLPKVAEWLIDSVSAEHWKLSEVNVIFCSDNYLLEINDKHLNHKYFTDIITFNYNQNQQLSGDLFISTERVLENADERDIGFEDELHRVIIHGLLHLCGYNDSTDEERLEIRSKEDFYLNLRPQNIRST
ncbi:MAG: rRNA maturation RNase YbeY [Verrucomicrobia bacterium]|nr:rRNA maturation RNase YbeY [Verrucomicrobiota bacterium]